MKTRVQNLFLVLACTGLLAMPAAAQTNLYLFSGSETNITLPLGTYTITAYGAQGGDGGDGEYEFSGGLGAEMEGQFNFATATTLTILVGGGGGDGYIGGGGGGSFVVNGSTPLIIAGGGGGSTYEEGGGRSSSTSTSGGPGGGPGGGGGGGGFYSNGGNGGGGGGASYGNGGGGGGGGGGYGGGGGAGGGGGGGYSGGGGGLDEEGSFPGGGGGSIIDSSAITNLAEVSGIASPDDSTGNGEIIITAVSTAVPAPQWNIVWSDEFKGTSINTNNWTYGLGNGFYFNGDYISGWGNNELEYYTDSPTNAYVSNGLLHIVERQQTTNDEYGTYYFTSARLTTEGLYNTPTYGRFQWRAALPSGIGMWPALWMMGVGWLTIGWPACGEIDVVENNGATPTWVQGTIHSGTNGDVPHTAIYYFPSGGSVTNFHTYLLDWEPTSISWYVDGQLYETQSGGAPFNAPFFINMNVAVGGYYVGEPSSSSTSVGNIEAGTVFPQQMLVDYVRVLELTAPLAISATQSNGDFVLSWPTNIVCHLQTLTNSLAGGNWSDLSNTTSPFVITPDPTQTNVFYRLESP